MIKLNAVCSIEWENWDTFIFGRIYDGKSARSFTDEDEYLDALLSVKGTIWTHCGGKHDFLWLLQKARERKLGMKVPRGGANIISIQIGQTNFQDSYPLLQMPLQEAVQMFLTKGTSDLVRLYETLDSLNKYAEKHGLLLSYTIAASAWKTAKGKYGIPSVKRPRWQQN